MSKKIVVALGGNALIKPGERPTVYTQFCNTRQALAPIAGLICKGHRIVMTHGNGPQVGNILIRSERSAGYAYELPLGVCVAQSQGEMGYMISQEMKNSLRRCKAKDRNVVAMVTQVLVDPDDPAMSNPTKPVGPFFDSDRAEELKKEGVAVTEDAGRGFRRVVPSPIPYRILESDSVKRLYEQGLVVIAVGGGGCPVYMRDNEVIDGVDAVIDKDLASKVLALEIGAEVLVISTAVEHVYLNFNKPGQKAVNRATVTEMKQWLREGHFAAGSMKPKIQAAVEFLEGGGEEVIITTPELVEKAVDGDAGTHIVRQ
ncbi:MAG: carbamate kinase [Planctomycetota bacterium]|nr:carbamate kinase [Planctomycetota bacterium]